MCGLFQISKIHKFSSEQEMCKVLSWNHTKCVNSLNPFQKSFFFFFGLQSVQSYNVVVINTYCISSVGTNEKFDLNSVVTLSCLKTLESIVLIVYKTKFCYLLYFQNFFLFFRKILSPFCFLIFVNICFSSVFFPKRLF